MRPTAASHNPTRPQSPDARQTAASGAAVTTPVDPSVQRTADSLMFKLTGVPLEQMAKMNGRRVQVAGHIDATTVVDTAREANPRPADGVDAATFVVVSIAGIDGKCPKR